jgi:ketosteroid isomerase-like protein
MNKQQNTALIRSLYDAFERKDIQFILDQLTGDVEWTLEGPAVIPYAGKRVGPAQVMEFFNALAGTQENIRLTTEQIVAQNDAVATLGRYAAKVTPTGKPWLTPTPTRRPLRADLNNLPRRT